MLKKIKTIALLIAILGVMTSCSITTPVCATSNPIGSKVGSAKSFQVLGFFWDGGDMSIRKAAKNGGITKISTVDFKRSIVFLSFVLSYETIVTGE
jgi:hypothetical protein